MDENDFRFEEMTRILYVGTEWVPIPPITGGALEIWVYEVSCRLQKLGFGITIISAHHPSLPSHEYFKGVEILRVPPLFGSIIAPAYVKQHLYMVWAAVRSALEEKDLIHIQNAYRAIPFAKKLNRHTPVVISVQNIPLLRKISSFCYKMADRIHVPSVFMRKVLVENVRVDPAKIRVIYNGVDLETFRPRDKMRLRRKLGFGLDPIILFVGQIRSIKGPQVLLQAIPRISEKFPNVKFVFVGPYTYGAGGKYPDSFYFELVRQFRSNSNIVYLGLINNRMRLAEIYASSDIFVCPSIWQEPLGTVVIEAMASGLPVVASNVGGIPEMVRNWETGILVPPGDPRALEKSILYLLENADAGATMGNKGRREAQRRFSWENVTRKISKMYEEVL